MSITHARGVTVEVTRMPGRYAARLSAREMEKITAAAAAGQWEKAIGQLITTLHARAGSSLLPNAMNCVLDALNMPGERLEVLMHPDRRTATGGPVTAVPHQRGR